MPTGIAPVELTTHTSVYLCVLHVAFELRSGVLDATLMLRFKINCVGDAMSKQLHAASIVSD